MNEYFNIYWSVKKFFDSKGNIFSIVPKYSTDFVLNKLMNKKTTQLYKISFSNIQKLFPSLHEFLICCVSNFFKNPKFNLLNFMKNDEKLYNNYKKFKSMLVAPDMTLQFDKDFISENKITDLNFEKYYKDDKLSLISIYILWKNDKVKLTESLINKMNKLSGIAPHIGVNI